MRLLPNCLNASTEKSKTEDGSLELGTVPCIVKANRIKAKHKQPSNHLNKSVKNGQ